MSDELKHYGVPGMRWGVRKNNLSKSSDHIKFSNIKKKKIRDMSDDELKILIKRTKLLKEYKKAILKRPKKADTLSDEELEREIRRGKLFKLNMFSSLKKMNEIAKMSDDEIKVILKRAELEREYYSINSFDIKAAKKVIKQIFAFEKRYANGK